MIERYLSSASTYAQSIDHVFLLIAVLVGFWFLLAEGVFFALLYKYRAREGRASQFVSGEEKHLKRWVSTPHMLVIACDLLIIVAATKVWIDVKQTMPDSDRTIRVIGQQFSWTFQDPGPDGALDTDDDVRAVDELHVIVDRTYHFDVQSRDVVHSFAVPSFRLKQDAVPGRTITGWFRASQVGTYDIQCTQMCGIGHGLMAGRIVVETPELHAAWMQKQMNPTPSETDADSEPSEPAQSEADANTGEVQP